MKKVLITIGVIVTALAAAYIGVGAYFNTHYLWNTTINGVDCGGKTVDYAIKQNKKQVESYVLTITDRKKNTYYLSAEDIDYVYVESGEEQDIMDSQSGFAWITSFSKKSEYTLKAAVTFDEEKVKEEVKYLEIFYKDYYEKPTNAQLILGEDGYELIEETQGCQPKKKVVTNKVLEAIWAGEEYLELDDSCYKKPEITTESEEIANMVKQIDAFTNATIHYEIENEDENLTASMIYKMLKIGNGEEVVLDEAAVAKFVQHLATKYNTYADKREFQTSMGDTVYVGGGDYGWVINKKKEQEQIIEDLKNGVPVSREPIYEQRALVSGLQDIGNTYVEIDYTNQHLWFYKEGELVVETDIVSGNISRQNGSVDGVFKIVYKEKNATLVGEDYSSSVTYFMPFAYNIGIHDASWRNKFGGQIYKTSGSHGCVNVPFDAAKTIFENIEKGTPVVAFYREEVVLTNNAAKMSNAFSYVDPEKLKEEEKNGR